MDFIKEFSQMEKFTKRTCQCDPCLVESCYKFVFDPMSSFRSIEWRSQLRLVQYNKPYNTRFG